MYTKENFYSWIDEMLNKSIPKKVIALNFNLMECPNSTYKAEIIGSDMFDENDEDWACKEVFTTRKNQFKFKLQGKWSEVLETLSDDLNEYIKSSEKLLSYRAIGIGFVDGNVNILNNNGDYK